MYLKFCALYIKTEIVDCPVAGRQEDGHEGEALESPGVIALLGNQARHAPAAVGREGRKVGEGPQAQAQGNCP